MQWGPKGRHAHSKAMKSAWTQNVMCTVWFDSRGVLLVDYLPQGQTINAEHIMDQLHRLHTAVLSKRRIMRQKPFIIWDNARPHAAARSRAKVEELGFRQLNHPAYSLDLAIPDFHLFGPMKKALRGQGAYQGRKKFTEIFVSDKMHRTHRGAVSITCVAT